MYSGFAVYSLERELSSLEKRKVLVKDKIDTCKKSGGPKNVDVTKQLEQLRLPPIINQSGQAPEKIKKKKKPSSLDDTAKTDDVDSLKLPPLSPLRKQVDEEVFNSRPQSRKSEKPRSRPASGKACRKLHGV